MNILFIILKHLIWKFQIYNLFREIFKFREDKSNNVFREIRKCLRKTAKLLVGEPPRTAASFYSANMCILSKKEFCVGSDVYSIWCILTFDNQVFLIKL